MARNDGYWGDKQIWDQVNYRYINNAAARTAALLAGDVDVIDKVSVSDLAKLQKAPNVSVYPYDGLRVMLLQPSFNPRPARTSPTTPASRWTRTRCWTCACARR